MDGVNQTRGQMRGPIREVKSNDLSDQQILDLWIPFDKMTDGKALSFYDPATAMATLVLGGKGSGKTHLLRFFSFPVQGLRYSQENREWKSCISEDGYIGIYTRAGGLNGSRFNGKGHEADRWRTVFSYYIELWLGIEFLEVIGNLLRQMPEVREKEKSLVAGFSGCFDVSPEFGNSTIEAFAVALKNLRRDVDLRVNEVAFGGDLDIDIRCSPGRVIFGFPQVTRDLGRPFDSIQFSYAIDEYENFLVYQQECLNTLLRERETPVTFRVGARSYGMKSYGTNSAGEDIRVGSEFDELMLDARLRGNAERFGAFARRMVTLRTSGYGGPRTVEELEQCFEQPSRASRLDADVALHRLRGQLRDVMSKANVDSIISLFEEETSPLVQKAQIYALYQDFVSGEEKLLVAAEKIRRTQKGGNRRVKTLLGHFRGDFEAQLRRENRGSSDEAVILDDLVTMSEGLPRVFLTVIKNIFSWVEFETGGLSGETTPISVEARRRGLQEASRWFFTDVPQSGSEGQVLVASIGRLATLFRLNRFADKPTECSLLQFSVPLDRVSVEVRERIRNAENRCLLIRCPSGEKDRNSTEVRAKFYLNRILCPMFELPTGRRGTARFSVATTEAIFAESEDARFEAVQREWSSRLNWPFAKTRGRGRLQGPEGQGEIF